MFYQYLTDQNAQVQVGLSGFGVELAIKNTEYKAVDDSNKKDDDNEDEEVHGFNFGTLRFVQAVKVSYQITLARTFLT